MTDPIAAIHQIANKQEEYEAQALCNAPEPPPLHNENIPIWDLVIQDMKDRDNMGRAKYGTPLQAHNGRDMLVDSYQEILDFVVYLRGYIEERKNELNKFDEINFIDSWMDAENDVHQVALNHGWWEGERNDGEIIALTHSELSEALEALRHGNGSSEHIPEFSGVEEELADVVIRIMDWAHHQGYRIPQAILAKMEFNESRPYKHGKKF